MGSVGIGSFSDYSGRVPSNPNDNSGGSSGADKCGQAFNTQLEEISRCFYFINHGNVPPVGMDIIITFNGVRLVAENKLGEEIGYLPTKYNYLRFCQEDGFTYSGVIVHSSNLPTPSVTIDVTPL